MATAKNLSSKVLRNGEVYYNWSPISTAWLPNHVGYFDQANFVTVIKFDTDSYASSISFSWTTTEQYYGNGTVKYKLLDYEDGSFNNAGASTAADGSFSAKQSAYSRNTLTISRTIAPGTHYLYLWQGIAGEHFTTIYWGSGGSYGATMEYAAIAGTASTISVTGGQLGQVVTTRITSNNSQFKHTLNWEFAGRSGVIVERTADLTVLWTPDAYTFGAYIPNATSAEMVITCTTYIGDEQIGSPQATKLTMRLPADSAPDVSDGWAEVLFSNAGTGAAAKNVCLQGKSRIIVAFDSGKVAAKYGATIRMFKARLGAKEIEGSGAIGVAAAGNNEVTVTVTDSRGVSTSQTRTIYAYPYSTPVLLNVRAVRSNSDGDEDDAGAYVNASASISYSDAGGAISCVLYGQIAPTGGTWGGRQNMIPAQANVLGGSLDVAASYVVRIVAEDDIGGISAVEVVIPTSECVFNILEGGRGAGFGKYAEVPGALDMGWDIRMNGHTLTGLPTPAYTADAVPKNYADRYSPVGAKDNHVSDLCHIWTDGTFDNATMHDSVVATEDASTLINSPITSGAFYAARHVDYAHPHTLVTLREFYPAKGRVWTNMYFGNVHQWSGWTASYPNNYLADPATSQWEWTTPPMEVGVEYCTAERWGGMAVYTMLINCGALTSQKAITLLNHTASVIRYGGNVNGNTPLPGHSVSANPGDYIECMIYNDVAGLTANILCGANKVGQSLTLQIWYTK